MSQENVKVARRWVELFNERGDVAEFLSLLDPEVELQAPAGPRLRGHDEARDWFEAGFENVQPRIIPDRFVDEGDTVVGLGRTEVRWMESGEVAHEGESAAAIWFRDGKILRWQPFDSHAAALEAAGLSPRFQLRREQRGRMAEQSIDIVRRMYDAFHRGDAAAATDCFHPDVVVDASRRIDGGIGQGRDELNRIVGAWLGAFEEWSEELEQMRDLGDKVLVVSTQRGRGKGSGTEVEARYALLYEVRDGAITKMTMYTDLDEAHEAADASP